MTSIERFFRNNINSKDDVRQVCIDLFSGQVIQTNPPSEPDVDEPLSDSEAIYTDVKTYSL